MSSNPTGGYIDSKPAVNPFFFSFPHLISSRFQVCNFSALPRTVAPTHNRLYKMISFRSIPTAAAAFATITSAICA